MAKRKSSLGILFWIAFILLVLVIFLFNRTRIDNVLESTGFLEVVKKKFGAEGQPEVQVMPIPKQESENNPGANPENQNRQNEPLSLNAPEDATSSENDPVETQPLSSDDTSEPAIQPNKPDVPSKRQPSEERRMRKATLYYILVDNDGRINLKGVIRPVYYIDSPLTSTLQELISGPTHEDIREGLMSLIPDNTRIISVTVQNGTAFINFNEEFRFNSLGIDGYIAQLKQVVYSATEFSTVKNVQFLINGKKLDYLTAEGIFIGKPLTRESF